MSTLQKVFNELKSKNGGTTQLAAYLAGGGDPNAQIGTPGAPILNVATQYARATAVSLLLKQPNIDVNATDVGGPAYSPFWYAATAFNGACSNPAAALACWKAILKHPKTIVTDEVLVAVRGRFKGFGTLVPGAWREFGKLAKK